MNPKWMIGIITLWLMLGLIGGIIEYAYLGEGGETSKLEVLIAPLLANSIGGFIGSVVTAVTTMDWWSALVGMFLMDFAMFTGVWVIVQWVFFLPLVAAVSISFVITLLQIVRG